MKRTRTAIQMIICQMSFLLVFASSWASSWASGLASANETSNAPLGAWYVFTNNEFAPLTDLHLEDLAKSPDANHPIAVLLHGQDIDSELNCGQGLNALNTLLPLAGALSAQPGLYKMVVGYAYPCHEDILSLGEHFTKSLAQLEGQRKHMIAYSMGGLIARAIERDGNDYAIDHLVTLGTPHAGIQVPEDIVDLLPMAPMLALFNPSMAPLVKQILSLEQLFHDSEVMVQVNQQAGEKVTIPYHIIQGQITEPRQELPVSAMLMTNIYAPTATKTDGIVPTLDSATLSELLPTTTLTVHNFEGVDHVELIGKDFVSATLIPLLANLASPAR